MKTATLGFLASTLVLFLTGCGGGGKGGPTPPSPPPSNNGQVSATLTASPSRVRSGEATILSVTVTGPGPISISWRQEPTSPSGRFIQVDDSHTRWEAPAVSNITEFKLIAVITFPLGFSISVSTTVTVDPGAGGGNGGNPPPSVTPPSVSLSYPPQDGKVNVVGEGVKLTLIGSVQAGSYPVSRLQVLDSDGSLLQEWVVNEGVFRVDLERFGLIGQKTVKVRVVDTAGNYGETQLQLINDPALLENLAREFLRRYCAAGDGKLVRFGDLNDGPLANPVRVYLWPEVQPYASLVQQACSFWESYTRIRFELIQRAPTESDPAPRIAIDAKFNSDAGYAAVTSRGTTSSTYKIDFGSITLYRGWYTTDETDKWQTLAHEIGHVILMTTGRGVDGQGHTDDGSIMDYRPGPIRLFLHPYQQRAIQILYSSNPGNPL